MFRLMANAVPALLLLGLFCQSALAAGDTITREVEFETADGWTIRGTLRLPAGADDDNEYPGMILLHEKEHDRNDFVGVGDDPGLAQRLPGHGFAVLNFDWRGRGASMGEHQPLNLERHDFTRYTENKMHLDVLAAMEFMSAYPGVDGFRLGIVALQFSAEHAVRAMQSTGIPTRALVLLGGSGLSQESKDFLASINVPIFTGASITDKPVFRDMTDVYTRAQHHNSYMVAPRAAGRGYNILFFEYLYNEVQSGRQSRMEHLIEWLGTQVRNLGRTRPITVETRDGFTIHGTFRYPDDLGRDGKLVPGVVIAPGGRSNRYSYYRFEEEMARRGLAVVSVEQRGRGQSMLGKTVEDPAIARLWAEDPTESPYFLDVLAGIEFLVAQQGIDPDRIALMGGARGTRNATLAAAVDPERIKAMVMVSVYLEDDMREVFETLDASALLIDTELNDSVTDTVEAHRILRNSELTIYPGLGNSHHIRYFERPGMVELVGDFLEREMSR